MEDGTYGKGFMVRESDVWRWNSMGFSPPNSLIFAFNQRDRVNDLFR